MRDESIIISNRIRLARNLKDIPFPNSLDIEGKKKVLDKVVKSIFESNSYISKEFEVLSLEGLKDYEKYSLIEKHLISKEMLLTTNSGVLINKDENISIMINEEDHIRLQVIDKGLDIEKSLDTASKIDDLMGETLDYSFDPTLGYTTSCITNIGCGLRASIMLHLPALTKEKKIGLLKKKLSVNGMTIRGFYGEGSDGVSNIYQISNKSSLGMRERDIIENLKSVVKKVVKLEVEEREKFIDNNSVEFEDRVFRSFGILKYAKIISSIDALNLLSNVRYGIEMGIINNIKLNSINHATNIIQSGNIQRILQRELTPRERDIERAKILNNMFE